LQVNLNQQEHDDIVDQLIQLDILNQDQTSFTLNFIMEFTPALIFKHTPTSTFMDHIFYTCMRIISKLHPELPYEDKVQISTICTSIFVEFYHLNIKSLVKYIKKHHKKRGNFIAK